MLVISIRPPTESTGPAKVVKAGNPPKARRGGKVITPVCLYDQIFCAQVEQMPPLELGLFQMSVAMQLMSGLHVWCLATQSGVFMFS